MAATGKYKVIEAQVLEASGYKRRLLEEALKDGAMSPERHARLMRQLELAIGQQKAAQQAVEAAEEKEKEEEGGESDKTGSGGTADSGGAGGGGGSSDGSDGSGDGVMRAREEDMSENQLNELEAFVLQFYLAEALLDRPAEPAAAGAPQATLLYDPGEGLAQVYEPVAPEHPDHTHDVAAYLVALEHHAAQRLGANTLQLRVGPDAVAVFGKKFGYVPYGDVVNRSGKPMQRIRKALTRAQIQCAPPPA